MSIKITKNGKYLVRLQIPTGKRNAKGQMKHRNLTHTCETESQAKIWEKQQQLMFTQTGIDNTLSASNFAEYREAKDIARNTDLREVAEFWAKHHPAGEILTVRQVWEKYESSTEFADYKPRTKANKKTGIVKFCQAFGDTPITDYRSISSN